MEKAVKARVFQNGRSQAVRIPAAYRFTKSEVYIRRNVETGELTLSERPPKRSFQALRKRLEDAGWADFELDRDHSLPVERDWM